MYRRYLVICFAAAFTGGLLIGALNRVIDPYTLFGSRKIEGVNVHKADFVKHLRLTNAYAPVRLKPDCLILGTSRAARGLSPDHPALAGLHCYNLALPSVSVYEILRYVQHAHAVRPLKKILIALDFRVFSQLEDNREFSESRMIVTSEGKPNRAFDLAYLADAVSALWSMDAVVSSLRTVRFQGWQKMTLADNGQWLNLDDRQDHAAAFAAYTRNTYDRFRDYRRKGLRLERNGEHFAELLRFAHREHIDVHLMVSPSHAWHWETMNLAGLWQQFEEIKRLLVRINGDEAERAAAEPFPLWDFSGPNAITTEVVPLDSKASMHWFWESVHYKPALGNLVMNSIFGYGPDAGEGGDALGTVLTRENVDSRLAIIREALGVYEAEHSGDVERIRKIIDL